MAILPKLICLPRAFKIGGLLGGRRSLAVLGLSAVVVVSFAAPAPPLDPAKLPAPAKEMVDFARDIQPLLESTCVKCHGPEKQKNGFRIDSAAGALAGGDNGTAIKPGDSSKSPLVYYTARLVPDFEMPPAGKGEPLTPLQVGLLRAWIDQGAHWPATAVVSLKTEETKEDLWSIKPLIRPPVPQPASAGVVLRNPVDNFIVTKLAEKGLSQSPEASRATLIRRIYFDLTGLPPGPEEFDAFLRDPNPLAYEKLVDRLLASPRYGERWARHWLDVVHYGETHGYDKDKPRPNAWPYRDYVIRSLNEDKPYWRFAQEQLAGDVLFPMTRDGIEALGFIAAGPWDFIGHAEVSESKIDGQVARHLDRDDMVANTIETFNSLTIQCAQCHNHKFDPIPQEDYYRLQAVFAAVDRADKKYDTDPEIARKRAGLGQKRSGLAARKKQLETAMRTAAGQPLVEIEKKIAELEKSPKNSEAFGYHSAIEAKADAVKWVQVDLGSSVAVSNVVLHPCKDDFNNIGAGFGFPVRYKVELSGDPEFKTGVETIADETPADVPNPKLSPKTYDARGRKARYIRMTAVKLAPRMNDYIFALAELEAFAAGGTNAAAGAAVSALDSIEAPARWRRANLTDGSFPVEGGTGSAELAEWRQKRSDLLEAAATEAERAELKGVREDLDELAREESKLPPQSVAYVGAVYNGSGAFTGTGGNGGKPRPIHILSRGNVQKPGLEAGPGALRAVRAIPSLFELSENSTEGDRRAALARWLTDPRQPLTWRSIVNRVWQYHFGRGIVETPNDFGHNGAGPTQPELLDWLAVEFRDGGQSLKQLHRLIVTSATYRQSSAGAPALSKIDADNRYLWRANRRKLEAEEIRDSVLSVAGIMDLKMYGPSFQDFVVDKPDHSPHYEYQLADPEDPKCHRRSIYRFLVRSQPDPLMTALDCADPSVQVARRNEGLSALQALALLNDPFMISMSKHFAEKVERSGGSLAERVERATAAAFGHAPTARDREAMEAYAKEYGLPNLCRVLFNLNEFVFVD